jgi:hypothetical protein
VDNQHRKISGYRELSQEEIDLMNEIKALGPQLEAVCNKVQDVLEAQMDVAQKGDDDALTAVFEAFDWKSDGVKSLKQGLMFLTRAIAKPTFF